MCSSDLYEAAVDSESAYEKLKQRTDERTASSMGAKGAKGAEGSVPGSGSGATPSVLSDLLFGSTGPRGGHRDGLLQAAAKSAARSMGSGVGRSILRGVLGGILGGGRR